MPPVNSKDGGSQSGPTHVNKTLHKIAQMAEVSAERKRAGSGEPSKVQSTNELDAPVLRRTPKGDEQPDFLVPTLYDIGTRDSRKIMDVAVFRLSKKDHRANQVIRYDLPDGHVEVSSGVHGMASVWDYDIVLMAVSHLTEAMNRHREGKGPKPSASFRPHVGDVLKFCRRENGGKQKNLISSALDRLASTYVTIERTRKIKNKLVTIKEGENLIAKKSVIENATTGKVEFVEFKIADWMYREITEGKTPDVLTVHPDYFLISEGIGRFVYRLARRAAGKTTATWGFRTIYERSGSTGTFKEFSRIVRKLIAAGDFPEYTLKEEDGQMGALLVMTHKNLVEGSKDEPEPEPEKDEAAE
ncbi:replication initiator protein A [Pseudomonas syringae]|uniref:replication initiator protein A n=1 Tax=Pseudomonas syringae TaxID=317 RepID=UPI001372D3D1|nr:replication initiator protein A [Pseudomonas syringae]NAP32618.1 replication protein RepA [Pseudomonas syringae]